MHSQPDVPCSAEKSPGDPCQTRVAGFSLVELLLVLVIIAVCAAMGMGRYSGTIGNQSLEAAARRVCADLELARSKAIALRTSKVVRFTTSTGVYTLEGFADIDRVGQTYTVNLTKAPYEVAISSVNLDGASGAAVTFDAYGRPVLSASGSTSARLQVAIGARGRTLYVVVDSTTGRARVETTAGS
jgi:prepilin-type N-terminal cleavage/methylation domain-containing protein